MTPVAEMVGSHRIVQGNGIVHPLGSAEASPGEEKKLRRRILERALDALCTGVDKPTVFK
jgi:betaine reductase